MSLISWTLFKSQKLWDKFGLDSMLGKSDQLFKVIGKFKYLCMEDLRQIFLIKNFSINVVFLDNETGEITTETYLLCITDIENSVQRFGAGALFIVRSYILGLVWGNDSTTYLLDSHSNDENGNLSCSKYISSSKV